MFGLFFGTLCLFGLIWMARHARQLDIMVRQVEDEIGVINMAIGAAHAGCRAMCATSGGGFALMTEGLGAAAMMEIDPTGQPPEGSSASSSSPDSIVMKSVPGFDGCSAIRCTQCPTSAVGSGMNSRTS